MHVDSLDRVTELVAQNKHLYEEQKRVSICGHMTYSQREEGFQFQVLKEYIPDIKNAYLNLLSVRIAANNVELNELGVKTL